MRSVRALARVRVGPPGCCGSCSDPTGQRGPRPAHHRPGPGRGDRLPVTPHLSVLRLTGGQPDEARLIFDDGSITVGAQVIYQVPTNGEPFKVASTDPQEGEPSCDDSEQICWGPRTVGPWLGTRVELTYLGVPCVITASPVDRTSIDCTDAG